LYPEYWVVKSVINEKWVDKIISRAYLWESAGMAHASRLGGVKPTRP